eukprot:symbB.v1.2.003003.t1/scaffold113.1/size324549/1
MNRSFENCILCQQCGSKIPSYEERHDLEDGFESDGGACCYAGRKREEQVRREAQKNRDALDARIDRLQRLSTEALKGLNDGAAMMFEALIAAEENSDPDASPPDWFKERWSGEDPVPSTMALGAGCSLGISLAVSSALTGVPSPRTPDEIIRPSKRPRTCSTMSCVPGPKTPPELILETVPQTPPLDELPERYLDVVPQTPPLDELNSPDGSPPPTPTSPASNPSPISIDIDSDSEPVLGVMHVQETDAIHSQKNHTTTTIIDNGSNSNSNVIVVNDDDDTTSTASGCSSLNSAC